MGPLTRFNRRQRYEDSTKKGHRSKERLLKRDHSDIQRKARAGFFIMQWRPDNSSAHFSSHADTDPTLDMSLPRMFPVRLSISPTTYVVRSIPSLSRYPLHLPRESHSVGARDGLLLHVTVMIRFHAEVLVRSYARPGTLLPRKIDLQAVA